MLGWKIVARKVDSSVSFEKARDIMKSIGFEEHVANPDHAVFKKSGTSMTISAKKIPLEVAMTRAESGLHLQVGYDAFVLFDTGDLEKIADDLAAQLSQ